MPGALSAPLRRIRFWVAYRNEVARCVRTTLDLGYPLSPAGLAIIRANVRADLEKHGPSSKLGRLLRSVEREGITSGTLRQD